MNSCFSVDLRKEDLQKIGRIEMNLKRKIVSLVVSITVGLLASVSWAGAQEFPLPKVPNKPQSEWVVGVAMIEFKHPFWGGEIQACKDAAKKYGWKLDIRDCQGDDATQIAVIERFITKGVDLIILPAVHKASLVSAVRLANQAGIPVLTLNRGILRGEGAKPVAYVGADDFKGGVIQGHMVVEITGGKGNIITLETRLGSGPQIDRHGGLESVIQNYDITIGALYPTHGDREKTLAAVQDALVKFPKGQLDAIVCHDSEMPMMALQAVKAAGRTELIGKIIAFDYPQYTKDAILKGELYGSVLQDPYLQAMICNDAAWLWLSGHGDRIPDPWHTPLVAVTKDNAAQYPASW